MTVAQPASGRALHLPGWAAGVVAAAVVVMALLLTATPAAAHVELSESNPQNVSTVPGPVPEIRLTFSAAADAVADQFELRDAANADVPIASIENEGETILVVIPAIPLTSGRSRLTWAIRSGDSHTMTGNLSFTVTAAESAEGAPTTSAPPVVTDAEVAAAEPTETDGGTLPKGTADHLATVSRWVVYAALFLSVGGLAYLAWVHRGSEGEGRRLVFYVRRAAVVVLLASVVEWMAQLVAARSGDIWAIGAPGAWGDLASTGFGRGTLLRLVGGVLVLAFLRIDHVEHNFWTTDLGYDDAESFSLDRPSGVGVATRTEPALSRLRVEASPLAFIGAAALVVSEAFIGHTATVEPRFVVLLSDAGHLLAGAAWVAGGLMLALTLRRRQQRGQPLDARLLATRFSVMASWALAAVTVTGVALAWSILRTPSALWSTEFGKVLLLKLAVVAVVLAIGTHNHRVLVPTLAEGDVNAAHRFQRLLSIEVALFGAILLFTALLVVSNPT